MAAAPAPELGDLCEDLLSGRGEATGLAIGRSVLDRYRALDAEGRRGFFAMLRDRFGVDEPALDAALARWRTGDGADPRALHTASEPRSQELIRRLNRAPGGTRELVAMRADLLAAMTDDPALAPLDTDFRHLFVSWFNRGFLELRRIDWHTPAAVLETIILHEAVHQITGWDDLRHRVAAPDRRLYAFFHPALRDNPLIFVEVALTDATPEAIAPILAEARRPLAPQAATTAVFYSISNCQPGLRGVSFGNFLIKQVAEELAREFPGITRFVTLSPVPGLRAWALEQAARGALPERHLHAVERLEKGAAEPQMAEIAARYLTAAKAPQGGALDPVARFHLGNGARLERINPEADAGPAARESAWGVMVNYLYDLDTIERNHEAYSNAGEVVASASVRRLAKAR